MLMTVGAIIYGLFITITIIQIFYYLYFFRRVAYFKPKEQEHSQQHPVLVIICARDEDENMARNLPGILVREYATTPEVLVVNANYAVHEEYILGGLRE